MSEKRTKAEIKRLLREQRDEWDRIDSEINFLQDDLKCIEENILELEAEFEGSEEVWEDPDRPFREGQLRGARDLGFKTDNWYVYQERAR